MRKTMLALTLAIAGVSAVPAAAATNVQPAATEQAWSPQTVQQYRDDRNRGDRYRGDRNGNRNWDRDNRRSNRERRMARNDRIWRDRDGRYRCRRSDGTTGLVIGAALGGVLGNSVAGRGDRTLGTILGIAGGGLLGREIDRGNVRCR